MPKPNNAPQVNIQRPCYAMASTDGQTADITMYGEIVETQPIDWWTDEPIPGQYIIESEFLSDLQQVENCPQIIIRMDSLGGDAGVSILIRQGHEADLHCGRRGHVWRQSYHVRLRYGKGESFQPCDDSQVLDSHSRRAQC